MCRCTSPILQVDTLNSHDPHPDEYTLSIHFTAQEIRHTHSNAFLPTDGCAAVLSTVLEGMGYGVAWAYMQNCKGKCGFYIMVC